MTVKRQIPFHITEFESVYFPPKFIDVNQPIPAVCKVSGPFQKYTKFSHGIGNIL